MRFGDVMYRINPPRTSAPPVPTKTSEIVIHESASFPSSTVAVFETGHVVWFPQSLFADSYFR
jgi:hypothetical protein